jgi:hypothetical protein
MFWAAAHRRACSGALPSPRILAYRCPCSSFESAKLRSTVFGGRTFPKVKNIDRFN